MSWLIEKVVGRVRMADIAKSDYEVENDFTAETVSMTCSVLYSLPGGHGQATVYRGGGLNHHHLLLSVQKTVMGITRFITRCTRLLGM